MSLIKDGGEHRKEVEGKGNTREERVTGEECRRASGFRTDLEEREGGIATHEYKSKGWRVNPPSGSSRRSIVQIRDLRLKGLPGQTEVDQGCSLWAHPSPKNEANGPLLSKADWRLKL